MKKSIILISMAAAVLFSACQKSQNPAKGLAFTALVEQPSVGGSTKTYLDGTQVKWSANDAISVFTDASENVKLTLSGGEGTAIANFTTTATVSGNPTCALYPYKAENTASGKTVSFTLPAHQTYKKNTFSDGANYTIANITGRDLYFQNVCGILRLSLRGNYPIEKIELKGKSGEKLNGLFSVDASSANPAATCVSTSEESEQIITLDCNGAVPIVDSLFNFVVPEGAFTNGFTAKAYYTINGETKTIEWSTTNDNTITRSMIRKMPKQIIHPELPVGYTAVECIFGIGGTKQAYIIPEVSSSADLVTTILFQYRIGMGDKPDCRLFGTYTDGAAYYVGTDTGRSFSANFFDCLYGPKNSTAWITTDKAFDFDCHKLVFGNGEFRMDGELLKTLSTEGFTGTSDIGLLAVLGDTYLYSCSAKLYACSFENNSEGLLRQFIPVVKDLGGANEKAGLYDLVSNTFFTSANSSKFSYIAY